MRERELQEEEERGEKPLFSGTGEREGGRHPSDISESSRRHLRKSRDPGARFSFTWATGCHVAFAHLRLFWIPARVQVQVVAELLEHGAVHLEPSVVRAAQGRKVDRLEGAVLRLGGVQAHGVAAGAGAPLAVEGPGRHSAGAGVDEPDRGDGLDVHGVNSARRETGGGGSVDDLDEGHYWFYLFVFQEEERRRERQSYDDTKESLGERKVKGVTQSWTA